MNNQVASLSLSITTLLASSLLQTTTARATDIKPKPTTLSKGCTSEVISNPIFDKLDVAEPVLDKIDAAGLDLPKASGSSNPKLMQKPGEGQQQLCS